MSTVHDSGDGPRSRRRRVERSRRASAMRASTCRARREISSACLTRPSLSARRSSSAARSAATAASSGGPPSAGGGPRAPRSCRTVSASAAAATAATAASRSIFSICGRNASMTAWLISGLSSSAVTRFEQQAPVGGSALDVRRRARGLGGRAYREHHEHDAGEQRGYVAGVPVSGHDGADHRGRQYCHASVRGRNVRQRLKTVADPS